MAEWSRQEVNEGIELAATLALKNTDERRNGLTELRTSVTVEIVVEEKVLSSHSGTAKEDKVVE